MLVTRHLVSPTDCSAVAWKYPKAWPTEESSHVGFSDLHVFLCFIIAKFCCFSNVYRHFNGHSQSSVTDSALETSPTHAVELGCIDCHILTLEEAHMPIIREMEQSGSADLGHGQNLTVTAHSI